MLSKLPVSSVPRAAKIVPLFSMKVNRWVAGENGVLVVTPSGSLRAGVDDWIVRCAGRFVLCPAALFSVLTGESIARTAEALCSECCDPVPHADLFLVASGAELCQDCLLEYQLVLEAPDPSI